ncbi:uncharacterized protein UTRI_03651_B [Ustilago trichophora]|uniref:BZIP domain-containing protein n=1 Tax=Ustilago trichophora TaxID=86804 RepID=A0A5C3E331_9BASI|nr:uncharacterized protein UTRI_03651_B [Ustilago trichophora]
MVAPTTQCKPRLGQQQQQSPSLEQAPQNTLFESNSTTSATAPISLRAHLEAAISNPSSPSAQANLLKHLQSTLAAIRPLPKQAAATTNSPAHSTTPTQPTFARVPSITPAAVASALAAATAGRRHSLSSTPVSSAGSYNPAQKQRLEQIRYYQQLIAQLNATMPASAADGSVPTLPFEAQRGMDSVKNEAGFNAVLGLNPMSADDPSWIGHGFQAQAAEDFLSSPEWTDPSPALTDSMSFEIDSCGPSPLLPLDSYEDDLGVPGIAGAPLFPPQDGYASSNVSPLELAHHDFGANTVGDFGAPSEMGSDFTLFPEAKSAHKLPVEMAFSKLSQPTVGGASTEDPAITLLRALSSAALSNSATTASVAVNTSAASVAPVAPALTASPLAFTSMAAPLAPASAPVPAPALAPAPVTSKSETSSPALDRRSSSSSNKTDSRGTKRRLDSTDLLPLDAPIQKRTYYTVSATSRRDTAASASSAEVDEFAEEEAAIRREKDPRVAKRLSNTLAARRSRHRKAEELRLLHEKIEALTSEVESWKRRCELAEKERDDARALL